MEVVFPTCMPQVVEQAVKAGVLAGSRTHTSHHCPVLFDQPLTCVLFSYVVFSTMTLILKTITNLYLLMQIHAKSRTLLLVCSEVT